MAHEREVIDLEMRVQTLSRDATSPVTQTAVCAVIRDVLVPMLNAEIRATGFFGFLARMALGRVREILDAYLARNCP